MSPRTDGDLGLALRSAYQAGQAALRHFRTDLQVRYKGPDQPLTRADLEADEILRSRIREARPSDGWLSEETEDDPARLERDRVWIVDPIDGTRSFLRGYPEYAVSVALAVAGRPVLGVVYNPAETTVAWARMGGGAWELPDWDGTVPPGDGRPLKVGEKAGDPPSVLASRTEIARGELAPLEPDWEVRPLGSTAWKLIGVAQGRADAYLSRGPKSEWDVAAAALVVEEAGGRVTDLDGRPYEYNRAAPVTTGTVAGNPAVHRMLLDRVAGLPPPRRPGTEIEQDREV